MSDLFFDARSAAAWLANAVGRSIGQLFIQFVSTTSNGLGMQPSHHRDSSETTMSQLQGFTSRHPTSLLFVQTIQQSFSCRCSCTSGVSCPPRQIAHPQS